MVVANVQKNGPADKAGFQKGDKILKVNDEQISSASYLINYVAMQAPNSTIQVSIERDGKPMTLNVVVTERQVQNQNSDAQYIPLPR